MVMKLRQLLTDYFSNSAGDSPFLATLVTPGLRFRDHYFRYLKSKV